LKIQELAKRVSDMDKPEMLAYLNYAFEDGALMDSVLTKIGNAGRTQGFQRYQKIEAKKRADARCIGKSKIYFSHRKRIGGFGKTWGAVPVSVGVW
jgi:hypothetical protein